VFPQADLCNKSDDQNSVGTRLALSLGIYFFRYVGTMASGSEPGLAETCASHLPFQKDVIEATPRGLSIWPYGRKVIRWMEILQPELD